VIRYDGASGAALQAVNAARRVLSGLPVRAGADPRHRSRQIHRFQALLQHYATKAEVHSLRARQNRAEGYVRSRVFDEIRLAKVRLAQREAAESAAVGTHAVHLAADTRSSLIINWLTRFCGDLTERHPDVPEVGRFREQARDYIRKTAPARLGEL